MLKIFFNSDIIITYQSGMFCVLAAFERRYSMGYNDDHYKKEEGGDYKNQDEIERAFANGHLRETSTGYWDKETGETYWKDGTKR